MNQSDHFVNTKIVLKFVILKLCQITTSLESLTIGSFLIS